MLKWIFFIYCSGRSGKQSTICSQCADMCPSKVQIINQVTSIFDLFFHILGICSQVWFCFGFFIAHKLKMHKKRWMRNTLKVCQPAVPLMATSYSNWTLAVTEVNGKHRCLSGCRSHLLPMLLWSVFHHFIWIKHVVSWNTCVLEREWLWE